MTPHAQADPIFAVIDDLVAPELFEAACAACERAGWQFGHGSHDGDAIPFWKLDLDGDPSFDAIWQAARERGEALVGGPLRVIRQYANGHTYGLGGRIHADDAKPGTYTLLYYPVRAWERDWGGETVFVDGEGEIVRAVRPKPNRALFFDSRIPHAGHAPARACPTLRITVAFKLERVEGADGLAEIEREGARRVFRIEFPREEVRALAIERLEEIGRSVRLPGFRPGKIPTATLVKRYGGKASAEAMERLAANSLSRLAARGNVVSEIESEGEAAIRVTATHLPDLPPFEAANQRLERLTASDPALAPALLEHLHRQILDRLDAAYDFPIASTLVDREFDALAAAAAEQWNGIAADPASRNEALRELRIIAERRVRLGAVVAELARRNGIPAGPGIERRVIAWILERAQVRERPATEEEIALLIWSDLSSPNGF